MNCQCWNDDFSRKFEHEILEIFGKWSYVSDVKTDLVDGVDYYLADDRLDMIACRVRRHSALLKYGDQFTIRYARADGGKTEFNKIMTNGKCKVMFYGFADEKEEHLEKWFVGSAEAFREWALPILTNEAERGFADYLHQNSDGSAFLAIPKADVPGLVLFDSDTWNNGDDRRIKPLGTRKRVLKISYIKDKVG